MIDISVRSVNFARVPGGFSLCPVNNFLYNDLCCLISGLLQSNVDFEIDESFILTVTLVNVMIVIGETFMTYKKSDRPEENEIWKTVRDGRRCLQKVVLIFCFLPQTASFGNGEPPFYDGSHLDTILNLTGAAGNRFFCNHCNRHGCGNWCNLCHKKYNVNKLCYVQPFGREINVSNIRKTPKKKNLFIFYDFETRQDSPYRDHDSIKIHVPNLCIVQQVCDNEEN
ncbi:hypothetical protein TSAR_007032 [Trichomalopsis sarcophagae]|uniref:Uncharacterized protein n=1 Tax=Trichomalopsis sarcophagae TaxID=543379 RepID=A0A232ETA2_9HYME|nr:hypothetical protein TSAR_007032 [Trichomalopsis sarcophagae]